MTQTTPPRLGVAVNYDFFDTLGDWIFAHDRTIEIQDFASPEALTGDTEPLIGKYRALLKDFGGEIGIHGPFMGFDIATTDPEVRAVVHKRLLQGLDVAEKLGATHMVVHSPFTQWHTQNHYNFNWMRGQMFEAAAAALAPALERAGEIGCTLMLENINDVAPGDRRELADAIASPWLKLSVDTGHAHLVHGSDGAPPVDYFLIDAGARLGHVHLQDADGYADRHWIPGEGSINWTSVFDAIARLDSQPRLIVEVFRNIHRIPAAVAAFEARGLAA